MALAVAFVATALLAHRAAAQRGSCGGFARVRASEDLTYEDHALSIPVRPGYIVRLSKYCPKQEGANDARL